MYVFSKTHSVFLISVPFSYLARCISQVLYFLTFPLNLFLSYFKSGFIMSCTMYFSGNVISGPNFRSFEEYQAQTYLPACLRTTSMGGACI